MIQIFIICFSKETIEKAKQIYARYEWAYPILVPDVNNPIFENYAFVNYHTVLEPLVKDSTQYVGTMSHRAYQKINLTKVNEFIHQEAFKKYDVANFCVLSKDLKQGRFCNTHPHFQRIWHETLQKYASSKDCKESIFNYWIAKKDLFEEYCDALKNTIVPDLMKNPLAMSNAFYSGTMRVDNLMSLCGVPWYPHAPFLLERFSWAYFQHKGLNCLDLNLNLFGYL